MAQLGLVRLRPPRIAMGLVLVASAAQLFLAVPIHHTSPVTASIVGTAGFALMIRAWWLFKRAGTAICPTESSTRLVTHDVFALTRNPMYLGMVLMLGALAFWTGSLHFYVAVAVFALLIDRVFCAFEEDKAVSEFGNEYLAYRDRVRRWI